MRNTKRSNLQSNLKILQLPFKMKLKVVGTGSDGNCYILENETEALIIECGVQMKEIKRALDFNISKVVGALVSHEHGDHAKSLIETLNTGIKVFASSGTLTACQSENNHNTEVIVSKKVFTVGNFKIMPFDVKHDAAEPLGFIINHRETGNVLFLTDTFYSPYRFSNLNNIIIEANFAQDILDKKVQEGAKAYLRDRILKSHLSLEHCKDLLRSNDLSRVNNIVLIHLSDRNSDEKRFQREVYELTGKNVTVASNGIELKFNLTPF